MIDLAFLPGLMWKGWAGASSTLPYTGLCALTPTVLVTTCQDAFILFITCPFWPFFQTQNASAGRRRGVRYEDQHASHVKAFIPLPICGPLQCRYQTVKGLSTAYSVSYLLTFRNVAPCSQGSFFGKFQRKTSSAHFTLWGSLFNEPSA